MNRRNDPFDPQPPRDPRYGHAAQHHDDARPFRSGSGTPHDAPDGSSSVDYPYGVGFSRSQGGYIDREAARPSAPGSADAYQRVRPWGPQDGVEGDSTDRDPHQAHRVHDRGRARRRGVAGVDDQGLGPDIAPTRDFRGRGPKDYQRSDERLKEDICERLRDDPRIDASQITVDVTGGRVSLSGEVDSRRAKHQAEDLVDACRGVSEIDNRLRVRSGGPRDGG